jgi:anaerobic ribonucleoside-triphosphate reductase
MSITKVRKRDGSLVDFNKEKVIEAVFKAAQSVGGSDRKEAERIADLAIKILNDKFKPEYEPSVEEVQDVVEKALIETGHATTAKAYIVYRHQKSVEREIKRAMGVEDDLKLPLNSIQVLVPPQRRRRQGHRIPEPAFQEGGPLPGIERIQIRGG